MSKIELFEIERPCQAGFDTKQLALQDLKNVHSLFAYKLVEFQDGDVIVRWSPEDVLANFPELAPKPGDEFGPALNGLAVNYTLAVVSRYRTDWEPRGFGLGDLLYSVSLLPNEEHTLEVKTWETSQTQKDELAELEDKNSSDIKTTDSESKEVFDDYSSKESFEFSAHEEASFWVAKASMDQKYSTQSAEQHKTTAKDAHDKIKQSANQFSQKHSVKISSTREAGSESKSTRKLRNINQSRTLNINFFQMLRQYLISTYIVDSHLVLLGQEFMPNVSMTTGKPVVESAAVVDMIAALRKYTLDPVGERFQSTIMAHCTPRPDLCPTGLYGARRYAYEIAPGPLVDKDSDGIAEYPSGLGALLDYLYSFYSPSSPPIEMKGVQVVHEKKVQTRQSKAAITRTEIVVPRLHVLAGLTLKQMSNGIDKIKSNIIGGWQDTAQSLATEQLLASDAITLPTKGTYCEAMLGVCSGLEDYMEIQRQFDLELKQQEIEKLKLEVKKLELENQLIAAGKNVASVVVNDLPEQASVRLGIGVPAPSTELSFKKTP